MSFFTLIRWLSNKRFLYFLFSNHIVSFINSFKNFVKILLCVFTFLWSEIALFSLLFRWAGSFHLGGIGWIRLFLRGLVFLMLIEMSIKIFHNFIKLLLYFEFFTCILWFTCFWFDKDNWFHGIFLGRLIPFSIK